MARLRVEVVQALPDHQVVVVLYLGVDATAGDAALASGLAGAGHAPRLGISGRPVDWEERVRDGDRVELLRPLAADPKEARRRRARKRPRR